MPLAEIESFIQNRDITSIEEKLRQQREIVVRKELELKRVEQKIRHRLQWLEDAQSVPLNEIQVVQYPSQRIVWVDQPVKIEGFLDMEEPIRKLDQSDVEAVVFLGKVGVGIAKEHLEAGEISEYDGVFLVLDKEDIYDGKTSELPEAQCVRIRFRGSHTEAKVQYHKLLSYIREHNMQIDGFSREITLIDYGITNDTEKFVTEICIPVCS